MVDTQKHVIVDMSMLKYLFTGLGQFSYYLGYELLSNNIENHQYHFLLYPSEKEFFPSLEYRSHYMSAPRRILAKNSLPFISQYCDLWHIVSQNSHYFPFHTKKPIVFTVHDLNFLSVDDTKTKDKIYLLMKKKFDKAERITAISNTVKQDIEANFDLKGKSIDVIYNGVSVTKHTQSLCPKYIQNKKPFFITLGTITRRKNIHTLIEMMKYMPDYNLIIAGTKSDLGYINEMEKTITEYGLEDRIILTDTISDEEKYWLYYHCEALLFPSLLEGFGLPIIESFAFGKPVFASSLTSLPEVGSDIAFYWSNFQPQYMAELVQKGLTLTRNSKDYSERAKTHAGLFTWEKACVQYKQIYKEVMG